MLNGSNKQVDQLIIYVNKSLEDIKAKNNEITDLINKIDEYSKLNADKPTQIQDVI